MTSDERQASTMDKKVKKTHAVNVLGSGLVAVTSTLANAGGLVDMINREYADPNGDPVATLEMYAAFYNPTHEMVRDVLDSVPGLTRLVPRSAVA